MHSYAYSPNTAALATQFGHFVTRARASLFLMYKSFTALVRQQQQHRTSRVHTLHTRYSQSGSLFKVGQAHGKCYLCELCEVHQVRGGWLCCSPEFSPTFFLACFVLCARSVATERKYVYSLGRAILPHCFRESILIDRALRYYISFWTSFTQTAMGDLI